jgi:hypothetical protein
MQRPGANMVIILVSLVACAWQYRPVAAGIYVGQTWCTDQACARRVADQHRRDLEQAVAQHGAVGGDNYLGRSLTIVLAGGEESEAA